MTSGNFSRQSGFSLAELAIVLCIIGVIMGAIWSAAISARQTAKVEQSVEAISLLVDSTRAAYANSVAISGGTAGVVTQLAQLGAVPSNLLRHSATTCGVTSIMALASPFETGTSVGCGVLQVCDWTYGAQTGAICQSSDTNTSQYFAIEFDSLNYNSCIALVERINLSSPASGLKDIAINGGTGGSAGLVLNGGIIPVPSTTAGTLCVPSVTTNIVDFIYALRAPST